MRLDHFIYLLRDLGRLVERHYHFFVVFDVIGGEGPAFAVLKPLVQYLVPTDPEVPRLLGRRYRSTAPC